MKNIRFLVFLFVCFSVSSSAQDNDNKLNEIKSRLFNDGKPWILDSMVVFKGDSCENGQSYTFLNDSNKVKFKECKDNKWQTSDLTWELVRENELDVLLKMSNQKVYLIKFVKKQGQEKLRLRELTDKSGTNKDYYFNAR